jgi:hypothetical protein
MTGLWGIPTGETPADFGPTDQQASADTGPTPQPPSPTETHATPGTPPPLTLADVQQAVAPDRQQIDYGQRFHIYKQLMDEANKDAVREHLPESTKPGWLMQILTLGQAGLADQAYRTSYNAAIDQHNANVHLHNTKDALAMVGDDLKGQTGDLSSQIRMLGLTIQVERMKADQAFHAAELDARNRGIDISRDRLKLSQDKTGLIKAPNEQERAVLEDNGLEYQPDPRFPGFGHGVLKGSGGLGGTGAPDQSQPRANAMSPTAFTGGLIKRGFTPAQAAGIAANANVESNFDPGAINPSGGDSGLLQWTGPRLQGLRNFANATGRNWHDPETQMDWIALERSGESTKYGGTDESGNYAAALAGKTPAEIGGAFGQRVERPKDISTTIDRRTKLADLYTPRLGQQPVAPRPQTARFGAPSPAFREDQPAVDRTPSGTTAGLPTSGTTAGGIRFRVVTPTAPNVPQQPSAAPDLGPNAPGISAEERLRRTQEAEKTAAKPLPAKVQDQVALIDQGITALNEIEKLAQDPDVKKYIGPGMGRLYSGPMYKLGYGVSPKVNRYIQLVNYFNTQGVGQFLHGSRNPEIWKQVQAHFPKLSDEPDLALEKIRNAREVYQKNRAIELGTSAITRGGAATETPP